MNHIKCTGSALPGCAPHCKVINHRRLRIINICTFKGRNVTSKYISGLEDETIKLIRNAGNHLPTDSTTHPTRKGTTITPLRKSEKTHILY